MGLVASCNALFSVSKGDISDEDWGLNPIEIGSPAPVRSSQS